MASEAGTRPSLQLRHVLSYGLGVDSTAIILRWIREPHSRPFSLADLVVVSAQTGNEYPSTKALVERHILPLFRDVHIRYVQVARAGRRDADGYTVLDDSTSPDECYTGGAFSLGEELEENRPNQPFPA